MVAWSHGRVQNNLEECVMEAAWRQKCVSEEASKKERVMEEAWRMGSRGKVEEMGTK